MIQEESIIIPPPNVAIIKIA